MSSQTHKIFLLLIVLGRINLSLSQIASNREFISCTQNDWTDPCPIKYSPVCASAPQFCATRPCPQFKDFKNNCEACSEYNVDSYIPGKCKFTCDAINLPMPDQQTTDTPVCGYYRDNCKDSTCRRDFGSSILACQDTSVVSFANGACQDEEIQIFEENLALEESLFGEEEEELEKSFSNQQIIEQTLPLEESLVGSTFSTEEIVVDNNLDKNVEQEQGQALENTEETVENATGEITYLNFACQDEKEGNCSPGYLPVCAIICSSGACRRTFDNACFACMDSDVLSYSPGSCEEKRTKCDPYHMKFTPHECFAVSDPVCIYSQACVAEPCGTTAINPCQGCGWGGANYYTRGICMSDITKGLKSSPFG